MYTCINGFSHTFDIPNDTLSFQDTISDPLPRADFDIYDPGALMSYDTGQEVVIWDENAAAITFGGVTIASPPSQNFLINAILSSTANWTTSGTNAGLLTGWNGTVSMTFNNSPVANGLANQTTLYGYIHPGQSYMLSVWVTGISPVNIQSIVQMLWLDASGNFISNVYNIGTPPASNTRISISGVAPANAYFVQVQFGGQATNATNSGTILFSGSSGGGVYGTAKYGSATYGGITSVQLEPMWFTKEGVSYPTPDLNPTASPATILLPDGTLSRYCRLFAGTIDTLQVEYQGTLRIWHVSCAGSKGILENGMINGTYTAQYDDQIITSVVNTYFPNQIAINPANSIGAPNPIIRGVLMDSQNYTDNSLREVLNGLNDASSYPYNVDPYYRLFYNPAFYNVASFVLSDTANTQPAAYGAGAYGAGPYSFVASNAIPYYDYRWEKDATQRKRQIKVIGGKSGSTPQVSQVLDQDASNRPVSPAYTIPTYDAKVNDTNLTSTVTTTTRGLAEIAKFGSALQKITCKAQTYAPVGFIIYFTSILDNILNQPYVVQQVTGAYLGNSINEFSYTLGYYQPSLLDHIKNTNKALNRAGVATGVNNILAYDLAVRDTAIYSESVTLTVGTATSGGVYGTATYAGNAYG